MKPNFNDWFTDTNTTNIADKTSEKLFYNLTKDYNFDVEDNIDWSKVQIPDELLNKLLDYKFSVDVSAVTDKNPDGPGAFDTFMTAVGNHLQKEYAEGRIVGSDYATVYMAVIQSALQLGVEFALKKDSTYLSGIQAQLTALSSLLNVISTKLGIAKLKVETNNLKATFANSKLQLATIQEQVEGLRGQTLNTRTDGTVITGTMGKQKDVMSQQIIAFKQKASVEAAKIASDAWTVTKGVDEATPTPNSMSLNALNRVVDQVYANAGLPTVEGSTNNLNGSTPQ